MQRGTYEKSVEVVELQGVMEGACNKEAAVEDDDDPVEAKGLPDVVKNEYRCCEQYAVRAWPAN